MSTNHHQLVLSNPFSDSSSEDDRNTILSTPNAILHHLLPRHTVFRAIIHVHQITNIPLVSGEFGVKWKFKNVYVPKQGGLLGIVRSKSGRGGRREDDENDDGETASQGSGEQQHEQHSSQFLSTRWEPSSVPSSTTLSSASAPSSTAISSSSMSSRTAISSNASTYTSSSSRSSSSSSPPIIHGSIHSMSPASTSTTLSLSNPSLLTSTTPARGQTAFLPLKDHNVTWDHTLDVLIRMDVERSTLNLQPSPLSLVVIQAGPNGNVNAGTRLGVVHLDLAQYAGKGEVGRRYLLRESKTNATLKLTISLTYASGPATFHAPPLPKGEISNGISGILEENEVYRTRPRGLNLYGPYGDQDELEIDLLGAKAKGKNKEGDERDTRHRHSRTISSPTPTFDPERLPHAYGLKTTETLIEALFNPVVVGERRQESPFTVYVEPGAKSAPSTRPPPSPLGFGGANPQGTNGMAPGMAGRAPGTRPVPTRSGSGVGAGLGIMGLGMGMGIGMGVGVGVSGSRGSTDSRRPSMDSSTKGPRPSLHYRGPSQEGRRPSVDTYHSRLNVHPSETAASGTRQPSHGSESIWSSSTDMSGSGVSGYGASTESSSSSGHGQERSGGGYEDGGKRKGMREWLKKKMGSRPGTPTRALAY